MSLSNIVHVAVAVIRNPHGQYLIAKRPVESHQGGLWEFPGGKIEDNESVLEALKRELFEELDIELIHATPFIQIQHSYTDKSVLLDVWSVEEFSGEAFGKESQEIQWVNESELSLHDFPKANVPIIKAIKLPDKYMITGKFKNEQELLSRIQSGLDNGIKLIQFRAHDLPDEIYFDYAEKIYSICQKMNVSILLNTTLEKYKKYHANNFSHGLHLTVKETSLFSSNLFCDELLIATSIHNQEELQLAEKIKADFVVLSPVNKTTSHANSIPLGWDKFNELAEKAVMPIYALGGMKNKDLSMAKKRGAQGIAAIGAFWRV